MPCKGCYMHSNTPSEVTRQLTYCMPNKPAYVHKLKCTLQVAARWPSLMAWVTAYQQPAPSSSSYANDAGKHQPVLSCQSVSISSLREAGFHGASCLVVLLSTGQNGQAANTIASCIAACAGRVWVSYAIPASQASVLPLLLHCVPPQVRVSPTQCIKSPTC